jgi:hypothetical protein
MLGVLLNRVLHLIGHRDWGVNGKLHFGSLSTHQKDVGFFGLLVPHVFASKA